MSQTPSTAVTDPSADFSLPETPGVHSRRDVIRGGAAALAGLGLFGAAGAVSGQTSATLSSTGTAGVESPLPAGRLKGKVAVVTGAARGIGRAMAVAFAREGADVMGLDIAGPVSTVTAYPAATSDDLEETGKMVKDLGRRFVAVKADVRDLPALREAAARVTKEFGRLDIVVANAGIQGFKPLLEMEDKNWHDIIDVNLTGAANTLRAFAPVLVEQKQGGRIILTSSTQGRHGSKNASAYASSKWGIYGLMKSAALELGEHKITVNCVVPGLIDTPMTRNPTRWTEAIKEDGRKPSNPPTEEEIIQAQLPHIPLKVPWLKPEDVATAAVFLATDDAHMVSGSSYDVTAGDTAHFI